MAVQAQFPLSGSQDWVENGYGDGGGFNQLYCYYLQQEQQKQQLQQCNIQMIQNQLQKNQNLCFDNSFTGSSSSSLNTSNYQTSMAYSQCFSDDDEKQRQEIDHFIRLQNERLRLFLQEQRKQQLASLMKSIESMAMPLLRQKDEEIAQAAQRITELEDFIKRLEMENQLWQRVAQENEAMVISLNNTIEQLREKGLFCFENGAEDAESCCDMNREEEAEEKSRVFVDDNVTEEEERARKKMMTMVCRGCNSRNSCILFLPCRHLSSCEACETFLDSCPVCQAPKKATIEALIV
ncbi:probable BOI-related E3 ubiquitin-protein ligase 2 [Manihot esculenta]|uniref:RING-type domain-containing protein n=1 Tax=Manihot esculenta TaxID=3983 RepID=A0A2C9V1E5_MANES|nr:probable BOI-related E3 ubiquitin-protein ligase 2 [Manihot esculenta]OAY37365.1 hypothetical protein MANES_11G096100v8 [Manihot esculenta]